MTEKLANEMNTNEVLVKHVVNGEIESACKTFNCQYATKLKTHSDTEKYRDI